MGKKIIEEGGEGEGEEEERVGRRGGWSGSGSDDQGRGGKDMTGIKRWRKGF